MLVFLKRAEISRSLSRNENPWHKLRVQRSENSIGNFGSFELFERIRRK